jgi:hypothetical protein
MKEYRRIRARLQRGTLSQDDWATWLRHARAVRDVIGPGLVLKLETWQRAIASVGADELDRLLAEAKTPDLDAFGALHDLIFPDEETTAPSEADDEGRK